MTSFTPFKPLFTRERKKTSESNYLLCNEVGKKKHFSCYKLLDSNEVLLLFVVHLPSGMYKEEVARSNYAINISKLMSKLEEKQFNNCVYKSIVIGDFNLQPYSQGIMGIHGFNATMSIE